MIYAAIEVFKIKAMEHLKIIAGEIGPRGATTTNEYKAGEYVKQLFGNLGFKTQIQEFYSIPSFSHPYIIIYLLALIGILASYFYPLFLILTIFSYPLYVLEYLYMKPIVSRLIASIIKRRSRNIIGIYRSGSPKVRIIFSAHIDSTKAAEVFKPEKIKRLRSLLSLSFYMFLFLFIYSIIYIVVATLNLIPNISIFSLELKYILYLIELLLSIPIIINLINLFEREFRHEYVPGANDNGSGIAVLLALAEIISENKPNNIEIYFVATGSEEVGMLGMHHFKKNFRPILNNAYIINFDNPGKGKLAFTLCEGLIKLFCCKEGLLLKIAKDVGKELNISPFKYRLLPTDAILLIRDGFEAISIMAFDEDGFPIDYHWYNDDLRNINPENLRKAVEFSIKIIEEILRYHS